jgi:hypothetical protein
MGHLIALKLFDWTSVINSLKVTHHANVSLTFPPSLPPRRRPRDHGGTFRFSSPLPRLASSFLTENRERRLAGLVRPGACCDEPEITMGIDTKLLYLACSGARDSGNRIFELDRDLIGIAGFVCNAEGSQQLTVSCRVIAKDNATAIGLTVLQLLAFDPNLKECPVLVVTLEEGAVKAFNEYSLKWQHEVDRKLSPQKETFVTLRNQFQHRLSFRKSSGSETELMKQAKEDARGPQAELMRDYLLSLKQGRNLVEENLDRALESKTKGWKPGDSSTR